MSLCDLLSVDISFRASPVTALLCELLENGKLVHLGFISADNIKNRLDVSSPLSREENRELSEFLYSLGKTDSKSQLKLIESFKEYIRLAEHSYSEKHKKEAKLYLSFGFFSGALLSLLLV